MNEDLFINKLNKLLPDGFEAKKFNRMPRIHIKYRHYGFAVIDLRSDYYNLYVLGGLFSSIGVTRFERVKSYSNKTNRIMRIPYEDTVVLEKLLKYVKDNPFIVESSAVQSY